MSFNVRLARPAEVPQLRALIEQSVWQLSLAYYTPAQIESALRHVFGVDSQLLADGTYYIAEANGALAGCGGWSQRAALYGGDQHKATADPLLDPARDAARIRAFFVHPAWARRGVGRAIIEVCEAAARQAGFHRLELAATLPGEPLYTAMGYQATERLAPTLPDGQLLPIVHMHKLLV